MSDIVGRCLTGRDLLAFSYKHTFDDPLFRGGHQAIGGDFSDSWLPGQHDLPMNVFQYHNNQTVLIVLEISSKWVGVTLEERWRIMFIDPSLEDLFLQELGPKLLDIPIGENELVAHEEEEDEE